MAKENDTSSSLPMDIIETILSRLPAKSLVRFKSVSKSWSDLISDPRFIHSHLHRSKNSKNSHNLSLVVNSPATPSDKFSLVRYEDRKFRTEAVLEAANGCNNVLSSCDGVLLLTGHPARKFLLWNPSIRTTAEIRIPYKDYRKCFALCHDPMTDDFKVLFVSWDFYAVYSCKAKSWAGSRRHDLMGAFVRGLSVDGAVYWVRSQLMDGDDTYIIDIAYFDSGDDKLKLLQNPKGFNCMDQTPLCYDTYLIWLRDRLCLWFNNVYESIVQIWMKEEGRDHNSWTTFMTIDNVPSPFRRRMRFKPVCFQENKIVIHLRGGARFLVYRPREKTFEEFEDAETCEEFVVEGTGLINIELDPYVDSLLLFPFEFRRTPPQKKVKNYLVDCEGDIG